MMSSKVKKLMSDIGLFAIGTLGSKLLLFLLVPIYTNVLSSNEYGIADLVFTVGDLVLPCISLASYNGLLRFGLIPEKQSTTIRYCTNLFFAGSLITVIVTPLFGLYSPISQWKWFLTAKIITSYAQNSTFIILKVKDKNKTYAILSILQSGLLIVLNLILLYVLKLGIVGYLLSTILSSLIVAILAFIFSKAYFDYKSSKPDHLLFKSIVLFSTPFIFNDISWWLVHSSDKVMIQLFIGSSALGIYTAAAKIPSLINTFVSIFSQAWGIASIKEYDSSNDSSFYSGVFKYYLLFVSGICLLFNSFIKPFMGIYVGNAFYEGWKYVPILLVGATIASISTFMGSLLSASKNSTSIMISTIISAIVNVFFNYLLIPKIGILGACVGTLMAYLIVSIMRVVSVKRIIHINYNFKFILGLMLWLLLHAILVSLNYHIIEVSIVFAIVYLFILFRNSKGLIDHFMKGRIR